MSESPDFEYLQQPSREQFANTILESCTDTYTQYLTERHYATGTIEGYVRCVVHFAHWVKEHHF